MKWLPSLRNQDITFLHNVEMKEYGINHPS